MKAAKIVAATHLVHAPAVRQQQMQHLYQMRK